MEGVEASDICELIDVSDENSLKNVLSNSTTTNGKQNLKDCSI